MNTVSIRHLGVAIGGCLLLAATGCSSTQKTPLVPTAQNPAALGTVETKRTDNQNTEVALQVQHMAPPNKIAGDAKVYVVWAKPLVGGGEPQNVGAMIVGKDRTGELKTKTPLQRFDLLVTPEPSGIVSQPSHEPVMKAKVAP
jgi:hypothetical protein